MSYETIAETSSLLRVESRNGLYVAYALPNESMQGWGIGAITSPEYQDQDEFNHYVQSVVDSIIPVKPNERSYSDCTDGRSRMCLDDGQTVDVREKIVGADPIMALQIAETLGNGFFKDPDATIKDRLDQVVDFLLMNGYTPSSHYKCGAAAAYAPILENAASFTQFPNYVERQKFLLPNQVYHDKLRDHVDENYSQRLASERYRHWNPDLATDAVKEKVGDHGLVNVHDDHEYDGHVRGHVEGSIVRLRGISDAALDVNRLAELTGGRQAFSSNDERLWRLAKLFSRGNYTDFRIACMAAEDFTDAAHGTLANSLPTLIVEKAA